MNKHGGHPASCLCCSYLDLDHEGPWSEWTPDVHVYLSCKKGVFDQEGPKVAHDVGPNCQLFRGRED